MAVLVRTYQEQPAVWLPIEEEPPPEWIQWQEEENVSDDDQPSVVIVEL
jgi:hypothetical protein